MAAASSAGSTNSQVNKARKRLSIVSANTLADGLSHATIEDEAQQSEGVSGFESPFVSIYGGKSVKGYAPYNPSKANQDCFIAQSYDQSLILCVMDGHGENGEIVSGFLKEIWPDLLASHPEFYTDVPTALRDSIATAEQELLKHKDYSKMVDFSGTTFVAAVVRDDDMWVANIGDSRITKATRTPNGAFRAEAMSEDHKPDLPAEKARILEKGGRVFAVTYDDGIDGPHRVWLKNMDIPGLAMSRSLGDTVAHSAGVISDPEITHSKLTSDTAFLVLASDGLWEFMDDQCVVDMVAQNQTDDTETICQKLIDEAKKRWMDEEEVVDDTTVILVHMQGFPE
eukprot:CAMPEP_0185756434 /NCGR_PEP_ID=MMETSP1174-20130828/14868_1 /TAXON_ID=35687 /ORGANISM="Dictyocha speculum, Strain CCMP1381" /LENGTH=340 /DNA_ID=CAMNT_0028435397 /DNA_START=271 /DNA_END=1293 /DNA_ORIENTATION=-